jgi:hypothetical protein
MHRIIRNQFYRRIPGKEKAKKKRDTRKIRRKMDGKEKGLCSLFTTIALFHSRIFQ